MSQEVLALSKIGRPKDVFLTASHVSPAAFSNSSSVYESIEEAKIWITGKKFHDYVEDFMARPNGRFCLLQYWTEKPYKIRTDFQPSLIK